MDLKAVASVEGDTSAPSENMTITSTWSGDDEDEGESGSYYSDDDGTGSDYDSEASSDEESCQANKRQSYSKDLLKPTREGSLIQAGVFDPKQRSAAAEYAKNHPQHTPAYVHQQLKATSYGANVKKGADVPRDHVPPPVDPNAKLGEVYQRQSHKFKSTGYADRLKQGADVPRDHIIPPVDPNAKLGEVYASASTNLKKATGAAVAQRIRNSKKQSHTPSRSLPVVALQKTIPVEKPAIPSNALPPVVLQKTAPISKPEIPHNTLPPVALLKVDPPPERHDKPKAFELPPEFSVAQQNLKRRTERPWYSQGVPESRPSKKWFFQRGEWSEDTKNGPTTTTSESSPATHQSSGSRVSSWFFGGPGRDDHEATDVRPPTTTFFRGSNSTVITTKAKPANFHVANFYHHDGTQNSNKKSPSGSGRKNPKSSSVLKPFDQHYYENIQRRRKGLPPLEEARLPASRARTWMWCVVVVVVFAAALLAASRNIGNDHYVVALYREKVQPVVVLAYEDHIEPVYQVHVKPTVVMVVERLHPVASMAVDRTCTLIAEMAVSDNHHDNDEAPRSYPTWIRSGSEAAVSACSVMRDVVVGAASLPQGSSAMPREKPTVTTTRDNSGQMDQLAENPREQEIVDNTKERQGQRQKKQKGRNLFRPILGFFQRNKHQEDHCAV